MISDTTTNIRLNSLTSVKEVLTEIQDKEAYKRDVILSRRKLQIVHCDTGLGFHFGDETGLYCPTSTGLTQLAQLSGVPKNFLLDNEQKYPELASDILSHWFLDNDVVNRNRKRPVAAANQMQLFRCYNTLNEQDYGVLRAVRSDRYKILDNSDIAACVLSAISGREDIEVQGSVTDDRMFLTLTNWSLQRDLQVGDKVSFRVRIANSETGFSSLQVIPQIVVLSCLNGATVGRDLVRMHLGERMTNEDLLSQDTHNLRNQAFFAEVRDVINACFEDEQCDKIIEMLDRNGSQYIENSDTVMENVCKHFSIDDSTKQSIFAEFLGKEEPTRFSLSQACTQVAHKFEKRQYEKTAYLEDVGGRILTMSQREFANCAK